MRAFNLVKSLTNLVNNRKGLLILCLSLATIGVNDAWGKKQTFYAKCIVKPNNIKGGKVYVAAETSNLEDLAAEKYLSEDSSTKNKEAGSIVNTVSSTTIDFSGSAIPNAGYSYSGWNENGGTSVTISLKKHEYDYKAFSGYQKSLQYAPLTITATSTNNSGPTTKTFYAVFTPNTNTAYTVKHYKQNIDGSYPTQPFAIENFTGTTDASVTPAVKTGTDIIGFTAPETQTKAIAGDGSLVIEYKYTRNSYTLTWGGIDGATLSGGTPAGQVKFGATLSTPVPSKTGALFNGWSPEVPSTMPAENVTYTAQWVSKYNIEVNGSNQNMKVGDTQDNAFTFVHAENPTAKITIVSIDPINNGDGQVIEYDAANNKIIAHNAGTATICFKQAGTETMYESTSASFTYTVTKHNNHISINGSQDSYQTSCFMDGYAPITSLTATNTDYAGSPISNNQTSGNDIATFYQNLNVVYSTYKLGTATWTISQPENYKYKAANAMLTVKVVTQAEATDCYVLNDESEHSFSTGISDFEGHFDTPLKINGPANKLTYEAKKAKAGANQFVVQYSTDGGSNWIDIDMPDLTDSYKTFGPFNIPNNTTHIRFGAKTGGTLSKYYRNVRVTRKTYLNASDFTINTQSDNTTLIYPGNIGTGSFHVDYSLANGGDLKIVCDNPKFTIDKTTQTDVDCKSGSFDVKMTYTSQTAGTDYAHVVIYNNVYRKEITVTGITQKHQQTLNWKPNFDQMSLGQEVSDAASSSHGAVTYISDNPDVIRVDNGTTLVAVKKGEAKITATAAGDEEYEEKSIEKTISVTENHVQYIVWTQSLMGLKLGGEDKTLNAYATSEEEKGAASGRSITYTSDNTNVVSVSGNQLKIVGEGTANVTARQEGGNFAGITYDAVEKVNKVVVKDPSAQCESFVYEQDGNVEEFFQMNTFEITGTEHTLTGEPAKLTFNAKREYWKLVTNFSKGNIVVDAYTSSGWQQVLDCGEPPIGSYREYSVNLNRDVTKIRFRRPSGGEGYHYIADAKIEKARYIETSTPATFQANVGEVQQQTITLNYSNITSDLQLSMAGGVNSHFSVDKTEIDGDCGDVKKNISLTITYTPTANTDDNIDGKETETLIISDGTTQCEVKLYGKAAKVDRDIVWDIADENNAYTVEQIALTATAETKLHQPAGEVAYNIVGASTQGCGTIENKVLSFNKNGIVYVEASTIASDKYNQATNITKKWTVNLTPTEIVTDPEIDGDIVYGTQLKDIKLKANTGAAQNTVNQQAVEGTFAITSGDLSSAGEHTITVTFTPTNTDMFATCTKEINVSVQKANPSATAHASEIVYGAKVESSVLTNTGTTDGTWTWNDEEKEKVLAVGTHENLQVHFIPSDQANYNEIDGTVSLTITAATPTLAWTAKAETAQVHEVKTFTASSTNTDTDAEISYSIIEGDDCASIDASTGVLTITKAGTITIQASQAATTNFAAPSPITTTCIISLAPTSITTAPTTDNIVSGTSLSEVVLTGGEAQNTVNNQTVEGTFAVTGGETTAVGEQTLTITFAPTEADKYASCTTTISATVIQRTPTQTEVGTPSAADIEYGAAVNTSVLTGNGTLDGTWSWIDNRKDDVLPVGTHNDLQVRFTPTDGNVSSVDAVVSLTITGEMENKFIGNGDWSDPQNWTNGVPTDEGGHPNVVISGDMTISDAVSVGNLTIENNGQVTITGTGSLSITGSSETIEQYGNLIVSNGGNVSISIDGGVTVGSFIIESSIGTTGTSISGQVTNGDKVIYTNGAYIDINMDPDGTMDDTQWYGFTVPFLVDVENGVYRKEGDTYRKCTYGSDYMIAEYDATQRLNTGKGWKYIKTGQLQPGHFYYFTVNGSYNTYRFKAAESNITTNHNMTIAINGDGPNANWNAVGNSTLTYVNVTGDGLPQYVQTYINGQSTYQVVNTSNAQFVVGCPFFIQASENTTMVLQQANQTIDIHYAPREETTKPMCVRIAAEGQRFSDQMYLTASEDALDEYELGLDLAKAGVGTKSAQLWVNAYGQQLCVNNAVLTGNQAYYAMSIYAPQAGNYELSLPYVPTNGTLYLLQDGYPIWNLNESPYSLECAKGTTNEYGLLFVVQEPQAPTGSQTISGNQSAQKILKDQQIYIQKNGTIFTISGQKVK